MAHSNHARSLRYQNHRAWFQKTVKHSRPALDERRSANREIQAELADLQLSLWDPAVLLWGGTLADDKIVREREKVRRQGWPARQAIDYGDYYYGRDIYEYYGDDIWDQSGWDDSYCPCCDSYDRDPDWDDRFDGDVDSPGWVNAWVDGRAELPVDWRDYEYEYEYWYEDDLGYLCDQCGSWHDVYEARYGTSLCSEDDGTERPADLSALRDQERRRASERGRRRSARRR